MQRVLVNQFVQLPIRQISLSPLWHYKLHYYLRSLYLSCLSILSHFPSHRSHFLFLSWPAVRISPPWGMDWDLSPIQLESPSWVGPQSLWVIRSSQPLKVAKIVCDPSLHKKNSTEQNGVRRKRIEWVKVNEQESLKLVMRQQMKRPMPPITEKESVKGTVLTNVELAEWFSV